MKKTLLLAALTMVAGCTSNAPGNAVGANSSDANSSSAADTRTPAEVVQHHVDAIKAADMGPLMADYAPDAVLLTFEGLMPNAYPAKGPAIFAGKENARKVMTFLTNADHITAVRSMTDTIEPIGDDVAILHWKQFEGTPKEVVGEDIFIVKNGQITMQYLLP